MSKEKQIEIKVVTYKEERLNYFTALYEKAKNKFDRLFKKHKDAPYLSNEFQKMSDAGHEVEFLGDVVKMLKQSEWISVEERLPECERGAESKAVLFITKQGFMYTGYYGCGGIFHDRYFREFKNATEGYDISNVTHWMPLPEAPKKGGAE